MYPVGQVLPVPGAGSPQNLINSVNSYNQLIDNYNAQRQGLDEDNADLFADTFCLRFNNIIAALGQSAWFTNNSNNLDAARQFIGGIYAEMQLPLPQNLSVVPPAPPPAPPLLAPGGPGGAAILFGPGGVPLLPHCRQLHYQEGEQACLVLVVYSQDLEQDLG